MALWVRSTVRSRIGSTLLLALAAGLAFAAVGSTLQGARRATGAIERHKRLGRTYDVEVRACPPGVEPDDFEAMPDPQEAQDELCPTADFARLLATDPRVEAVNVESTSLIAFTRRDGSHAGVVGHEGYGPGVASVLRPIVVRGRLPIDDAPDEIVIGTAIADATGWRVGDVVPLRSWNNADRDRALSANVEPTIDLGSVRVVGIVREFVLNAYDGGGIVSGPYVASAVTPSAALARRWAPLTASYSSGVMVRLVDGAAAIDDFTSSLQDGYRGWSLTASFPVIGDLLSGTEQRVGFERQATWFVAVILAAAAGAFVTLAMIRQTRTELTDATTLQALGLTTPNIATGSVLRALSFAVPAAIICTVMMFAASPFTPFATARQLEYSIGVRVDLVAIGLALVGLLVASVIAALVAALTMGRRRLGGRARLVPTRLAPSAGPVTAASRGFLRGTGALSAIAFAAAAIAGLVGAAGSKSSAERVRAEPVRYGAWWDATIGLYSTPEQARRTLPLVLADPNITTAAAIYGETVSVNGQPVAFEEAIAVKGELDLPVVAGRAPSAPNEITVNALLAERLHVGLGDTVQVERNNGASGAEPARYRIVGTSIHDSNANGGDSALVALGHGPAENAYISKFAVRFGPTIDRDDAIEALDNELKGWVTVPRPYGNIRNVIDLRHVPLLIAGVIAALALSTVAHNVVTMLRRRRRELGVLSALGGSRRQIRLVAVAVGVWMMLAALAIGIPVGVVLGRHLWNALARSANNPSSAVVSGWSIASVVVGTLAIINVVTFTASHRPTRASLADLLRSE